MSNQWMPLVLTLAALGFAGPGRAALPAPKTVDQIALVVDQDAMTRGELEEGIQSLFALQGIKAPAPGTPDYQQAKKEVVDNFVREVLMAEEADREKIEIQDGDVDHQVNAELENMKKRYSSDQEFDDALKKEGITQDDLKQDIHDQLLRRIKANRILQMKQHDLPRTVFVTDAEVQGYFDEHPKDYEQVKFSIILLRVPPKSAPAYVKEVEKQAQGLLAQLKGGRISAAFAKKYSEDQSSADKGGQMDPMYRVDLNPKLADGIFNIPANEMGLVKADDGFYIVQVQHKGTADYQSVAPDIKEHLLKQKQDSAFNQWIESLKKDAYIVEDGQVVEYHEPAAPPSGTKPGNGAAKTPTPGATGSSPAPAAASTAQDQTASSAGPAAESADNSSESREIYPTLPSPGDLRWGWGRRAFPSRRRIYPISTGPRSTPAKVFPSASACISVWILPSIPPSNWGPVWRASANSGKRSIFPRWAGPPIATNGRLPRRDRDWKPRSLFHWTKAPISSFPPAGAITSWWARG